MAVVEPNKWYLIVTCWNPDCQRGIAFREAPSDGYLPEDSVPKIIELQCPFCSTNGRWFRDQVRRSQGGRKQ
jgi:hypothetical protein